MSRRDDAAGAPENDVLTSGQEYESQNIPGEPAGQAPSTLLTIEEHAQKQKISKPVFAAVMQMQGWDGGRKVTVQEFNSAASAFLGGSMAGSNPAKRGGK